MTRPQIKRHSHVLNEKLLIPHHHQYQASTPSFFFFPPKHLRYVVYNRLVRTWFPAVCCCSRPNCYGDAPNLGYWWGESGQQDWAGCGWSLTFSGENRLSEVVFWHRCTRAVVEAAAGGVWRWTGYVGYLAYLKRQRKGKETHRGLLLQKDQESMTMM